ncbi:glycosyltransferase family 2 protein [Candidatus Saccharibacteria bacterium]|nr:glycosyltransferase family 2 protein [Candidatus Saccharibacteria bacterium]
MKTSKKIKLSFIVPCYDVEEYLPKCLDSLMAQTLKDIEVICINDGSPDNCLKILKDYQKKYGDKIVIINKKNEGVWRGRKDGIKKARGEFIGFVDSDDYVTPDFAEKLYNAAIKNKADIAVCGFDRIDLETGKLYSREMCKPKHKNIIVKDNPGLLLELNGAPWNKIYKAELLKNMAELQNIPPVLDDMMFLQLIYINAHKITFIPDSLNRYMVRKDSIINTIEPEVIPQTYAAMKEIRNLYVTKKNQNYLDYVDANAFLHLGISFMYRLSANKNVNFSKLLKENTKFLNQNFPNWRHNQYISLKYTRKNNGSNNKLYLVKKIYDLHLFRPFLAVYKTMINKLGVDIKW